jgi:hypothetical protein
MARIDGIERCVHHLYSPTALVPLHCFFPHFERLRETYDNYYQGWRANFTNVSRMFNVVQSKVTVTSGPFAFTGVLGPVGPKCRAPARAGGPPTSGTTVPDER